MESYEEVRITRVIKGERESITDTVITETPLRIFLKGEEFTTIICTPDSLLELALGYLFSEGIIKRREDILSFSNDEKRGIVDLELTGVDTHTKGFGVKRLIQPGCFFYTTRKNEAHNIESELVLHPDGIRALLKKATSGSLLYRKTGGVHSAALCTEDKILLFYEDIGRHNAIDKILGRCLLEGIPTRDRIMVTSGRVSSAIILKVIKAEIPVLISSSAPTVESIKLARKFGVTLIGFVRGQRFNIYSNEWRVQS
jgi:FdhD protein